MIAAALKSGNPVVVLYTYEAVKDPPLHWAVITGMYRKDGKDYMIITNSSETLTVKKFVSAWSFNYDPAVREFLTWDLIRIFPRTMMYYSFRKL